LKQKVLPVSAKLFNIIFIFENCRHKFSLKFKDIGAIKLFLLLLFGPTWIEGDRPEK